jgi:hypothetical protein
LDLNDFLDARVCLDPRRIAEIREDVEAIGRDCKIAWQDLIVVQALMLGASVTWVVSGPLPRAFAVQSAPQSESDCETSRGESF